MYICGLGSCSLIVYCQVPMILQLLNSYHVETQMNIRCLVHAHGYPRHTNNLLKWKSYSHCN